MTCLFTDKRFVYDIQQSDLRHITSTRYVSLRLHISKKWHPSLMELPLRTVFHSICTVLCPNLRKIAMFFYCYCLVGTLQSIDVQTYTANQYVSKFINLASFIFITRCSSFIVEIFSELKVHIKLEIIVCRIWIPA